MFRLLTDRKKYKLLKQPLVLPLKRLSKEIKTYLASNKLLDFGLQVVPGKFKFGSNYGILPNSLVISYALTIATSGKAKRILLAGFDGYQKNDRRLKIIDEIFHNYSKAKGAIQLTAVTPSIYNIQKKSIYTL